MKIVHVQQYFNAGYGYQENILPAYQKELGHEVVFLTSTRSDGFNKEKREKTIGSFIENNFKVKRLPIRGEFKNRFVLFNDLYKYLLEEKPDYIFHHSVTSPSILTVAKYKKKFPDTILVVDNHADLQISGRNKLWKLFYYNMLWKSINKLVYPYIDRYFGVTPDRCLFLKEEIGVNEKKIELLPIGADTKSISRSSKDRENLIKEMGFPQDTFIFCHGGKMSLRKQTDDLIHAFIKLNNPKLRLLLFGDLLDEKLEKLINDDHRIKYIGWCDRKSLLEILSGSDVGIWNGQHTTLLEDAIACELPLILKEYGSTCHLIEDNGLFIKSSGQEDIFKAMNEVIKDEVLERVRSGAKSMRNNLSYEVIAVKSLNIKL